jgi:hypothetical protein
VSLMFFMFMILQSDPGPGHSTSNCPQPAGPAAKVVVTTTAEK